MKKLSVLLVAAVLTVSCLMPVAAQAVEVSGDAYVGVYTNYLWRGYNLSQDDAFVVQPGADVTVGGFTLSWWGNMSENSGDMNEVDLTLDYSKDITDLVSVSVGNILYDVDGLSDTNELYLGVSLNTLLSPSLTVYYDYQEFDGNVFTVLSVGHTIELADKLALNLGAAGSYFAMDKEFTGTGSDESFLHNGELSAGVDYAINDQLSASASLLYSFSLSDDAEDIGGLNSDAEAAAGVSVTLAF